jgi:hypothetical protein
LFLTPDPRLLVPGGGVAQLGERLLCKQEVIGSNPFTSTTSQALGFAGWQLQPSGAERHHRGMGQAAFGEASKISAAGDRGGG